MLIIICFNVGAYLLNKMAFSLIELMVVIAIVALLAAVAIPSYKTYIARTNITSVYSLLQNFEQTAMIQYQTTGTLPTNPSFSGVTLTPGSNISVNANGISTLNYQRLPTDTGGSLNGVAIIATLDSTFSKYCVSGNCQLRMASIAGSNGAIITNYCGQWTPGGGSNDDFSFTYLPSNCNCTNFTNIWSGGVISGGSGLNSC